MPNWRFLSLFLLQVKIAAKELDKAIAGLSMRVANNPDEVFFINLH